MTEDRRQTIIVNYGTPQDKSTFMAENADMLDQFKIIWVNDRHVDGVRIDYMPSDMWYPQPGLAGPF